MKTFFLTAKNWKIFLLIFIPFFLGFVVLFGFPFVYYIWQEETTYFKLLIYLLALFSFFGVSLFFKGTWQWLVVYHLNKKLSDDIQIDLKRYHQLSVVETINYILLIVLGYWIYYELSINQPFPIFKAVLVAPILFIQFLISLYAITIAAKVIKANEVKRKVELSECISELFMFYFIIVGVWMLQPKVNELYKNA